MSIEQGAGETNRLGRKCTIRKLHMMGQVYIPAGNALAAGTDICRVLVYLDKQSNGAAATVANILASAIFNSFRNLQNSERFYVLSDKRYTVNAPISGNGTSSLAGKVLRNWSINKNVNIPLQFDASTGAITDLTSSNIGVLVISEGQDCYYKYTWRLRFSDY